MRWGNRASWGIAKRRLFQNKFFLKKRFNAYACAHNVHILCTQSLTTVLGNRKKSSNILKSQGLNGAGNPVRTGDLLHGKQTLCQLSYTRRTGKTISYREENVNSARGRDRNFAFFFPRRHPVPLWPHPFRRPAGWLPPQKFVDLPSRRR